MPGLRKRNGVWHIDKKVFGKRICETTFTSSLNEAENFLAHRIEEIRQAKQYGIRPKRTFLEAATKYLRENQHKASLNKDAEQIKLLAPFIGELDLAAIHIGRLQEFIACRKRDGVKNRTVNYSLQVTRCILNLAAGEWMDENGLTWLQAAPKIKLLKETDRRNPYPLSWEEQDRLFELLPTHLQKMALFTVNTGCRDREVCRLQWGWEVKFDNNSVFVIPGKFVKNRDNRLVVLNDTARAVIDSVRDNHPQYVFTYKGKPINRMLTSAWKRAREKANLLEVRVHDLKHTFGRRLRAAGVSFEDRQDLLGHRSGRVTTHYSQAELENLITAANRVCNRSNCGTVINLLTHINNACVIGSRKSHATVL